jgi:deoxyribose-phosphate aldolase
MLVPKTDVEWAEMIYTQKGLLPENLALYPTPHRSRISRSIDHTQLTPSATESQIDTLCDEAREYGFATVCVRLRHVSRAVQNLRETPEVGVACVVGFHEGTYPTQEKVDEAQGAVNQGASELDMVINYPLLRQGLYTDVFGDVLAVRKVAPSAVQLKVILETSQLTRDEIIAASIISCMAGADYVKTSTGFNGPGAAVENVSLIRATVDLLGTGCKVKASGGVRGVENCIAMLKAGANRIGASAGVKIVKELAGDVKKIEQNSEQSC